MNEIKAWGRRNTAAIFLVILFGALFAASQRVDNSFLYWGTTGFQYLDGEYYRFITCLFFHYNPGHLLANSVALLSVSSLLSSLLRQRQTVLLFLSGGILSELAFSIVTSEQIYDIGASSGVFALIACLLVCYLRFQTQLHLKWYRPDLIIVLVYFVFANTSISAFLVHTFGFVAGILLSFVMVSAGRIKSCEQWEE